MQLDEKQRRLERLKAAMLEDAVEEPEVGDGGGREDVDCDETVACGCDVALSRRISSKYFLPIFIDLQRRVKSNL